MSKGLHGPSFQILPNNPPKTVFDPLWDGKDRVVKTEPQEPAPELAPETVADPQGPPPRPASQSQEAFAMGIQRTMDHYLAKNHEAGATEQRVPEEDAPRAQAAPKGPMASVAPAELVAPIAQVAPRSRDAPIASNPQVSGPQDFVGDWDFPMPVAMSNQGGHLAPTMGPNFAAHPAQRAPAFSAHLDPFAPHAPNSGAAPFPALPQHDLYPGFHNMNFWPMPANFPPQFQQQFFPHGFPNMLPFGQPSQHAQPFPMNFGNQEPILKRKRASDGSQSEVAVLRENLRLMEERKELYKHAANQTAHMVRNEQSMVAQLNEELQKTRNEAAQALRELNEQKTAKCELKAEKESLSNIHQSEVASLKAQMEASKLETERYKARKEAEFQKKTAEAAEALTELNEQKALNGKLLDENKNLKDQASQFAQVKTELQTKIDEDATTIKCLETMKVTLVKENQAMAQKISGLEAELTTKREEADKLNQAYTDLQKTTDKKISELENDQKDFDGQIQKLGADILALTELKRQSSEAMEKLKTELQEKDEAFAELQSLSAKRISDLEGAQKDSTSQLQKLGAENLEFLSNQKQTSEAMARLMTELQEKNNALGALQRESSETMGRLKTELKEKDEALGALQKTSLEAKNALPKLELESSETIRSLKVELQEKEENLAQVQKDFDKLQIHANEKDFLKKQAFDQVAALKTQLTAKEAERTLTHRTLIDYMTENREKVRVLEVQLRELQTTPIQETIKDLRAKNLRLINENYDDLDLIAELQVQLREKASNIQEELSKAKELNRAQEKKIKELEKLLEQHSEGRDDDNEQLEVDDN